MKEKRRCEWVNPKNELYIKYHDEEWGVPVHDDRKLFEMLILEGAQAGLSWETVLNKRENYKQAFDNFDANKIIKYDENKFNELMNNAGIIRNKLKIRATILNAQKFLEVQKEFGTFDKYIWSFVNHKPIENSFEKLSLKIFLLLINLPYISLATSTFNFPVSSSNQSLIELSYSYIS